MLWLELLDPDETAATFAPLPAALLLDDAEAEEIRAELPDNKEEETTGSGEAEFPTAEPLPDSDVEVATFIPLPTGLPLGTAEDEAADMELPDSDEEEAARTGEAEPPAAELLLEPDVGAAAFTPLPAGLPLGTAKDEVADTELLDDDEEEAARTGEAEPPTAELLPDPDAAAATFTSLPTGPVLVTGEAEAT